MMKSSRFKSKELNQILEISIRALFEVVHKKSTKTFHEKGRTVPRFQVYSSEGINKYRNGKGVCIGKIFFQKAQNPIYIRSNKTLILLGYALNRDEGYTLIQIICAEIMRLYACHLKEVSSYTLSSEQLTIKCIQKDVFNDLVEFVTKSFVNQGISSNFVDGSSVIRVTPADQYIKGDTICFKHKGGVATGIIQKVLKKGFHVLLGDEKLTISIHALT